MREGERERPPALGRKTEGTGLRERPGSPGPTTSWGAALPAPVYKDLARGHGSVEENVGGGNAAQDVGVRLVAHLNREVRKALSAGRGRCEIARQAGPGARRRAFGNVGGRPEAFRMCVMPLPAERGSARCTGRDSRLWVRASALCAQGGELVRVEGGVDGAEVQAIDDLAGNVVLPRGPPVAGEVPSPSNGACTAVAHLDQVAV